MCSLLIYRLPCLNTVNEGPLHPYLPEIPIVISTYVNAQTLLLATIADLRDTLDSMADSETTPPPLTETEKKEYVQK